MSKPRSLFSKSIAELVASETNEVVRVSMDITPQEAMKRLEQHFGSREEMLTHTLTMLSTSGQPTDITFTGGSQF